MAMNDDKALTYASYLRIDALLAQQHPRSDEHDELLFIVIHQVYELWFKQLLHELRGVRAALFAADTPRALALLKRVLTIFKTLVAQVDVLETMTPLSFAAFRARLATSSGFQSAQFRAVEFLLGYRRAEALAAHEADSAGHRLLSELLGELLGEPSVGEAFVHYLRACGVLPPTALADAPADAPNSPQLQAALLRVYRELPFPAQVCERLVDLDEGLQEWRYRHVKMVERTIGVKPGTGGSSGAGYLRETLFKPLFPELWAIRAQL